MNEQDRDPDPGSQKRQFEIGEQVDLSDIPELECIFKFEDDGRFYFVVGRTDAVITIKRVQLVTGGAWMMMDGSEQSVSPSLRVEIVSK